MIDYDRRFQIMFSVHVLRTIRYHLHQPVSEYRNNTYEREIFQSGKIGIFRYIFMVFFFLCFFYTGSPSPRVMWNTLGVNVDNTYSVESEKVVTNVLRIDRVHRDSLGKKLECEASNLPNKIQLKTSVTMNVYREYKRKIKKTILRFLKRLYK